MPTPEEKILNQLQGAPRINPASARLFTDWTLEPGDVVTVRSTEGDSVRNYQLPIYSMDFNWNGSPMMEISSSGNPEREPLPELVRKEYAEATSSRGMGRRIAETEEEISQYRTWQTKTDKKIGDYAEIMGVTIDPTTGDVVYETDEQGNIKTDEDGNPIPVFDPTSPYSLYAKHEVTAQRIVNYVGLTGIRFDAQGNPIYKQAKDAQGNPIYDAQGNPVYETDSQGNPIPDLDAADGHSMYSQISQTIGGIESTVSGHTGSISTLTQTATSLTTRIGTAEGNISTLQQTATNLTSRIETAEGKYSLIEQTATKVGMVVVTTKNQDGTETNKIDVAGIVTELNKDNTTETVIQANKIALRAGSQGQTTVKLSERVVIAPEGYTNIKGLLKVTSGSTGNERSVDINYGNITAYDISIKAGHSITFIGATEGERYPFDTDRAATLYNLTSTAGKKAVIDVQISGPDNNIYTLQKKYVGDSNFTDAGTFSRATTLSGEWSGGTYTVTASPQGNTESTTPFLRLNGNGSQSFSAEMLESSTSTDVLNSVYGYMVLTGSMTGTAVKVCQKSDGTGVVASYSVGFLYSDGQNSVNVSGPTWSAVDSSNPYSRTAIFSPSIGTGTPANLVLSGVWSYAGNAISASAKYIVSGNSTEAFSTTASLLKDYNQNNANNVLVYLTDGGQNRWAQTTINITPGTISIPDPTSTYNDGKYTISATGAFTVDNNSYSMTNGSYTLTATDAINDGKDSVTLTATNWSGGQRTFSTLGRHGTEVSLPVNLVGGTVGSYDSTENELSFNIYDGTGDNSVDTGADVVAAVVPGTVTVTQGTYNAVTHLLPITASALPTVGNAAIPISGSLDVPISGQWKFGSNGTGSTASENAMFGVYSGNTKLFGSSVTLEPSSGLVQLKEGSNVLAKISVSTPTPTYLDQWLYGTGGNDEEANTGAFYRVYANDYQHPVKGTQVQLTHSQAGTTRLVDYANTTKVLAKIDNPKVSGIVTSGYQKIILAASDTGANVSKEVRVTYTDGLGEDRNIIIDASAISSGSIYEGKASVGLNDLTWNPITGSSYPSSRTISAKTSGRTNTSGVEDEITKTLRVEPYLTYDGTNIYAWIRAGSGYTSISRVSGTISVTGASVTSSQVAYNKTNRTARGQVTGTISGTVNNTTFSKTFTLNNVNFDWAYQDGLDGKAYSERDYEFEDSSAGWSDEYPLNLREVYQKGVEHATPVFEPVARYVWAESNDGAIIFYKNSTGSTRWGTLEANTRVWLMQENAVNGRYYVKFESYNSGSGSFSEYLGYIPTQFVHDAMKSGLLPGGGWKEKPDEETTMYICDSSGNYVTVYSSNSINSSVVGQLYPNTEVTCLSVSNDWAQIRVVSNGYSVKCYVQYSIHLQSTETSPSKYGSARGWVKTPQVITIKGYQIEEIRHSSGIYSSPLNVKMSNIRDNSMREYTSTATQSTTYENIATSGDPGDFLNLVNTSSGLKYYAWHNSTTYSGDVGHKVKITVSYSDNNTETVWISILSKATNNYNYIN